MLKKRLLTGLVLIVGVLLIYGLSRNILRLLQAEKKVGQAQEELKRLELEQEELVQKKEYFESEEFIEQQARNKLNMAKEGEAVVILPPEGGRILDRGGEKDLAERSNWQSWLQVFGW